MRPARVAAVAAALAAAVAVLAAPAAPAAAQPTHVAIEVAFPGGGTRTACVPWQAGLTGDGVLQSAGFQPHYAANGLLDQINGVPASPDTTQAYWAYFHDGGSGWAYSLAGPLGYRPAAGTVEGWIYDSEQSTSTSVKPPPATSYSRICAGQDPPDPAPPTPVPVPPPAAMAPPAGSPSTPPAQRSGTHAAAGSVPPSSGTTTGTTADNTAGQASNGATSDVAASQAQTAPAASPVADRRATAPAESGRPPWGTVLGLAAIVLLAAAGWYWSRRRASP